MGHLGHRKRRSQEETVDVANADAAGSPQKLSERRKGRMSSAKNNVESLLRMLADDCTLEDIQYHLYVLEKIQRGLEVADTQGTLTQEEVEQRLSKWITR
jgi:hypothetical protein